MMDTYKRRGEANVVMGTPGIGKTGFNTFFLWHLLQQPPSDWQAVILKFSSVLPFYVFKNVKGTVQVESQTAPAVDTFAREANGPVWYLGDKRILPEHWGLPVRMASFDVRDFGHYFAAVRLSDPSQEPVPGVLVQGPDAPYILSVHHSFEKEAVLDKTYGAYLFLPDQLIQCEYAISNVQHDFILFRVLDFVDRDTAPVDISTDACNMGKAYIMFGYSTCFKVDAGGKWCLTWNVTPGHISSYMLNSRCVAASGVSVPGDSGGPVFSFESKRLIGMNLAVANVNPCWTVDQSARSRVSPQGVIKPLWFVEDLIALQIGRSFLAPGGIKAVYSSAPLVTSTHARGGVQMSLQVPRLVQETLCTQVPTMESEFSELFNGDLLDPYKG